MNFRFHVVALPHLATHRRNVACAYTMKVLNFCKMMTSLGHHVIHYGCEGSEVECTEHVNIITPAEQDEILGAYDHKTQLPNHLPFDPEHKAWQLCNARAIAEIVMRKQPRDFVGIIAGRCQKMIADNVGTDVMPVEYGVGYGGVFSPYCVYESYAHQAKCLARTSDDPDGRWYDAVIPNYYDPADFPFFDKPSALPYVAFVGRLINRKGLLAATQAADAAGIPLKIAGQGAREYQPYDVVSGRRARLVLSDGTEVLGDNFEYVGHVDIEQRAKLVGNARALLVPTSYLEPFGGVNVEAQMYGTPVITTDWGAFPETVEHGRTGYRCRTLDHFVYALKNVDQLDRRYIYERAHKTWSLYRVRTMYHEYFKGLQDLWTKSGWSTIHPDRQNLDWLSVQ